MLLFSARFFQLVDGNVLSRRALEILDHRDRFSVLDRRELVGRIELDGDLQLRGRKLRQTQLLLASCSGGCAAERLAFLEVNPRSLQLGSLQIHLIADVFGIDVQRFRILGDSFVPILDALGVAPFFEGVVARAGGQREG